MKQTERLYHAMDRLQKAKRTLKEMEETLESYREQLDPILLMGNKIPTLWPRNWDSNRFTALALEFSLYEACVDLGRMTLKKIDDAMKNALSYDRQDAIYRRQGGTAPVLDVDGKTMSLEDMVKEATGEIAAYGDDILSIHQEAIDHLETIAAML